jgi:hypothetical protein
MIPMRQALPVRLWAVAFAGAVGSLIYLGTFLAFAVKRSERQMYVEKINELISARRRRRIAAAA